MNRSRTLNSRVVEWSAGQCCLPSPRRLPQSVAGMAFNFSKVNLARPLEPSLRDAKETRGKVWASLCPDAH